MRCRQLTTLTEADVRLERRVELAFEGLRLFDIRRWKIAETVMPTTVVTGIDYINAAGTKVTATYPGLGASIPGSCVPLADPADGARPEPEPEAEPGILVIG